MGSDNSKDTVNQSETYKTDDQRRMERSNGDHPQFDENGICTNRTKTIFGVTYYKTREDIRDENQWRRDLEAPW